MVTEPSTRRILLGKKHRGFGIGMFNSFGGKLDPGETIVECAVRELQEETGIQVPCASHLSRAAKLHFTFDDSPTKMLVRVFRLDVTCQEGGDDGNYYKLDPSVVRGCDEITPQWLDDWRQIPLDNMFADDSLWLTHILESEDEDLFIEGHFHFQPGGQEVNSIQHYFMKIASSRGKSLEQRLFHELHRNEIQSPSIKEFNEGFAFANAVKSMFGRAAFDVVLDVAGGHGALAALLLVTTSAKEAVVIDPADVGKQGVTRAWRHYFKGKRLDYRYECLRTGLHAELNRFLKQGIEPSRILVVACHACQHLSDEILEIACSKYGVAAAVMPCCQRDTKGSWKSTSKNLGLSIATVMDLLLAGKAMSWSLPYDVRMKTIDAKITPQNRVILCRPLDQKDTTEVDKAHARLEQAYRSAHHLPKQRPTPRKIDVSTLTVGVAIGAAFALIVTRR
jgi:8-oxo-dGTP pyrophosphatase MutT (NUDIX family)/antitoxin component of RelBE/YafQ-DinJ toxin-antitoxin module